MTHTPVKKSHFPYGFVQKNNLFYVGPKPDIKYYKGIDNEFYDAINKEWVLVDETIEYLSNDLISLFNVMERFISKVYIDHHIHATKSLTISSLSMDIYLRRFYNGNIPLIKQKSVYNDIKSSYYGGITEVYKPFGKDLYYYDVNSLYPYSALNSMPGLSCVYTDNINKYFSEVGKELFGFYYCIIKASDSYIGLLPYRCD